MQEEVLLSPVELRDWLIASNTTRCFFTTVIAEELISLDWPQDVALKTMLVGGDQLQLQPPSPLPFDYVNVYGPTECTVISTAGGVSPRKGENVAPHIGRPLANTDLYVLGPIGVPGELYIGGDGVALGYLKQPKLTAEKFIPHPFKEGERLFRTGDLVRYRSDGNLEFLGRIDDQVKIRGFRIELGEIGVVIMGHSNVQAAVATVREDVPGRKRLVAYVVPAEGETLQIPELREYVKQKLPDYMVPVAWVMDALPLTPNEKVYRKELPAPDWTQTGQEESYVAPRIAVEKILAEVWSEVLGVEKLGYTMTFLNEVGTSF